MATLRSQLRAALRAAMEAAWTDVAPSTHGIFSPAEFASIPFEQEAEDGKLPMGVIDLSAVQDVGGRWGLRNRTLEGRADLYYVGETDYTVETMETALALLETRLNTVALSAGQRLNWAQSDPEPNVAGNVYFQATQRPFRLGLVYVMVTIGETP